MAMMKPRNSLPRVASSLWRVGISLGFTSLLSASCRLAAFQLSYSLSFSVVFIRSSSVLHFQVVGLGQRSRDRVPVLQNRWTPPVLRYILPRRLKILAARSSTLLLRPHRDRVPSLVAKVSEALDISPGQLNPPSWGRRDIPSVDLSLGEKTIKQVLELPIERRQVPFLVSKDALERCSIWDNMSGSKGEEAQAEYKRALEVMSVKKAAPKKAAPSENDDEGHSNKRQAASALASSSKKKHRASGSTSRVFPSSSSDPATVLANLNTKVFPLTPVILPDGDSSASIQLIQGDLLRAMSQLFHLGERMGDHASLKADLAELTFQLREEKDNVLAKEKEIKALKLKVRNQDEAGALAAAENVSLREQLEQREEEVCDLRCTADTFDAEKTMAVSGAIVVARWELMWEWLNHQTDSWDLEGALKQYKMVKTFEAEFQGISSPTFEGEPSIPSGTETEKTPEPVTDDPHAS
ncbi:hypothetical protein DY000_02014466 [Brassica cretica]|uniref:Uncharacterized protein n=1 Tax=Brassica cretica TaxID=69181 RepID=A0ABQ7D2M6_BRACR|nr:hypothetical protein DY000_02014466 [Brassica cretica]